MEPVRYKIGYKMGLKINNHREHVFSGKAVPWIPPHLQIQCVLVSKITWCVRNPIREQVENEIGNK